MRRLLLWLCLLPASLPAPAAGTLPTLPEAFGPGRVGVDGLAPGVALFRIDLPQQRYPDAMCADGSPVPLFVRRANDPRHRDDWVVYLQGGGSCENGQDCFERWQGRDGNFGANKLSSRFAPRRGIAGGGIHSLDARNPFAGWNHVFVLYCSSDGWAGTVRDRSTAARVGDGSEVRYRLHFLGARIVDATFDLLRSGATVRYRDASGAALALADLRAARTVLFAGSSAGGGGVIRNADRIRTLLTADRPGLRFAAVIDGSLGLAREGLDHAGSLACGEQSPDCSYAASMMRRWNDTVRGFWNALSDASCVALQTERGEPWRCADGVFITEQHLTTPMFVRSDLQDSLVLRNTLQAGYGYDGAPLDRVTYGHLLELQLLTFAQAARRIEPVTVPIGVFAPQCGAHVGLTSDPASYRHAIVADGRRHTFLSTLAGWLDGRPSVLVQRFDGSGAPASCGRRPADAG